MAQVLREYEFTRRATGGKFARYLDGQIWRLDPAEDTHNKNAASLRTALYSAARRVHKNVRIAVENDRAVIVQAAPETNGTHAGR